MIENWATNPSRICRGVTSTRAKSLAESVIGLFKTEVVERLGPWRTVPDVEWETMHWVDWYNEHRLLSSIGYMPPAEAERRHFERAQPATDVA